VCFSVQADLAVGLGLIPLAVATLAEVRTRRELPFALLPGLFAAHQLVEALVWLGVDGRADGRVQAAAAVAYLVFALPVLPVLLPVAVLLLEPHGARLRVAPFAVVGVVVAGYLGYVVLAEPVSVVRHAHALTYVTGIRNGGFWAVLYAVAVIGPALLSGYPTIVAFGVLNLVGSPWSRSCWCRASPRCGACMPRWPARWGWWACAGAGASRTRIGCTVSAELGRPDGWCAGRAGQSVAVAPRENVASRSCRL